MTFASALGDIEKYIAIPGIPFRMYRSTPALAILPPIGRIPRRNGQLGGARRRGGL